MKVSVMTPKLAAGILVVAVAVVGCGGGKSPNPASSTATPTSVSTATSMSTSTSNSTSPTSTTSAAPTTTSGAAQRSEYGGLLIKPTDIVVPNDTFTLAQTLPVPSPAGVEGVFKNQDGSRKIDDTIFVYPDAEAARQALDNYSRNKANASVQEAPTSVDVGTGGMMAMGQSPDGSKAKAIVMFTEGKAFAVVEFESRPEDMVRPDFVLGLARKQDDAIKRGLPA
jgi:hypothetical protein